MTAYEELEFLLHNDNPIAKFCKFGCDIMYYISDLTGFSYNQVNIFILYILQPLVLITTLIIIYYRLFNSSNIYNKIIFSIIIFLNVFLAVKFLKDIFNQDWNVLGNDIINKIQLTAHTIGWNYAEYNICVFVIMFIILLFANIIYIKFYNKKVLKVLSYFYWIYFNSFFLSFWIY